MTAHAAQKNMSTRGLLWSMSSHDDVHDDVRENFHNGIHDDVRENVSFLP